MILSLNFAFRIPMGLSLLEFPYSASEITARQKRTTHHFSPLRPSHSQEKINMMETFLAKRENEKVFEWESEEVTKQAGVFQLPFWCGQLPWGWLRSVSWWVSIRESPLHCQGIRSRAAIGGQTRAAQDFHDTAVRPTAVYRSWGHCSPLLPQCQSRHSLNKCKNQWAGP